MREDSQGSSNDLHFHNGSTCHGSPNLEVCIKEAVKMRWTGKVLERVDHYSNGKEVKCYSLIAYKFEHWGKFGKFVATLDSVMTVTRT